MAVEDLHKRAGNLILDKSHDVITTKEGKERFFTNMACYSHIWAGYAGMEKLHLMFPEPEVEAEEYVNWILNGDLWGEAFLTKTYKEGQESGYEIDIHKPTNFLFSAMAALRFPWECGHYPFGGVEWNFPEFREMGFSLKQSFFLTVNCQTDEKILKGNPYNANHLPIPRSFPFEKYSPEYFNRQQGTMYEGSRCSGVTANWEGGFSDYEGLWWKGFFNKRKSVKINPELIEKLKKYLKED